MTSKGVFVRPARRWALAAALLAAAVPLVAQSAPKHSYLEYEGGPEWIPGGNGVGSGLLGGGSGGWSLVSGNGATVGLSFAGVSQFDLRNLLGGSYIPPDTMGAIGATQFMETTNGVYAIYDKSTGALQSMLRADTFWQNAGATGGMNGDARLLYDAQSNRWVALQFGASVADVQIAVSDTSDAMGGWKSTSFTGYAGGVADFPTMALDSAGLYIGTNNFTSGGSFRGTTLNVIGRNDLFGPGAPTAANVVQFNNAYPGTGTDRGFAIQGVNSTGAATGRIVAASLYANDTVRYDVVNAGTAGATQTAPVLLGTANYADSNPKGYQPDGTRNIDAGDQRISGNAWEHDGKIYWVYTATPVGGNHTEVRWVVSNAETNALIQEGSIADPNFDYYMGSLSVNSFGQVVIGYNRSGLSATDGKVSLMARTFDSDASGALTQTAELMLHVSDVGDYHNGSGQGQPATGRQRWGDYSAVTVDPNDPFSFWVIGEYATNWNNAAGGYPGGNGASSWATWIAQVNVVGVVPEPGTYALMFAGLLVVGRVARRRRLEPVA